MADGTQGGGSFRAETSRRASGFNFTAHIRRLCADVVSRTSELAHVDLGQVLIAFAQTRRDSSYGRYASLTPLRFEDGSVTCRRHGRVFAMQRMFTPSGQELLYILTFYLPRFMNLPFREKLITIFHELWHISPAFDGDLRRHPGRCFAHSNSQKEYDAEMEALADRWLALAPAPGLYSFLRYDFTRLRNGYGRVLGTKVRRPRVLPVG